jgi:hypothetical protein
VSPLPIPTCICADTVFFSQCWTAKPMIIGGIRNAK